MPKLTHIFEGNFDGTPLDEILYLAAKICSTIDLALLREVDTDITLFFSGAAPNLPQQNLPYHNLRHSQMVVLATARLFHGLHCQHIHVQADTVFKGLLAAYFHDTGMLPQEGDGEDAKRGYMAEHESRSIVLLKHYAAKKGFAADVFVDCATIIRYTDLTSDPATFAYHSHEIQLAGQIVGSADILAQMADRYYLECLPLLFGEQQAGGINRHQTARELMEHTEKFYQNVILKRLASTFSNTSQAMQAHFRERYQLDRNLYLENITKNINYLKKIIADCDETDCLDKRLKRNPPPT